MPTVILLDTSLSMSKYIEIYDKATGDIKKQLKRDKFTKRDLSYLIIRKLVEHISKNDQFDYLSLIAFSSKAEILCKFTRNYIEILDSLDKIKIGDSGCLEDALNVASDLVIQEWTCLTNIQVLLITDQIDGFHDGSIKKFCAKLKENRRILKEYYLLNGIDFDEKIHINPLLNDDLLLRSDFDSNLRNKYFQCKFPFSFPNRFDIICLNESCLEANFNLANSSNKNYISFFEFDEENFQNKNFSYRNIMKSNYLSELIKLNNSPGKLFLTESIDKYYIEEEFCPFFLKEIYSLFQAELKCGNFKSIIKLFPSPIPFKGYQDYCYITKEIEKTIEICGFINVNDLTTPPTISRHLIIIDGQLDDAKSEVELNVSNEEINTNENNQAANDNESTLNIKSVASFVYLLHNSLKTENMAAIVKLRKEWYGALHSWQETKNDPKKKSHLMLSVFIPGDDVLHSIISKLNQSGKAANSTAANISTTSTGAANAQIIKSYTKGCIAWYQANNLQNDIQKIMRNAKKLPEKTTIFFKELNRVRKAALTFGFYDLFEGIALLLQRELPNINITTNPEAILQLTQAMSSLRSPEFKQYNKDIQIFDSSVYTRKK